MHGLQEHPRNRRVCTEVYVNEAKQRKIITPIGLFFPSGRAKYLYLSGIADATRTLSRSHVKITYGVRSPESIAVDSTENRVAGLHAKYGVAKFVRGAKRQKHGSEWDGKAKAEGRGFPGTGSNGGRSEICLLYCTEGAGVASVGAPCSVLRYSLAGRAYSTS